MKKRVLGYLSAAPRVSTRPEAELGGPRSHVLGVMQAFKTLGWEVLPFIVGDRVPIEWVAKGSSRKLKRNKLRLFLADITRVVLGVLNAFRAKREIGADVDMVYERFAAFQALGWIFKRNGVPWILETNAPLFLESKHDRQTIVLSALAKYLEVRAYRSCDTLVCISEALKEIVIEFVGLEAEKIVVVPNGVDTTFFDPQNHRPLLKKKGFTIGFVGSLIEWQGLALLLEVTRELIDQGEQIHLVMVGNGPAKDDLIAKTHELALDDVVQFIGYVPREEVPGYIASFDTGYSGQIPLKVGKMYLSPLKLYEYMAMSKPVIASDFADARRVVDEGETGFLFNGGDHASLKGAILAAIAHQSLLPEMGAAARATVVSKHSWEARISTLLSIIGEE